MTNQIGSRRSQPGAPVKGFRSKIAALISCFAILPMVAMPVTGVAQETTAGMRGSITAPDGSPAANTTVRVTDTRTGATRSYTTSSTGGFYAGGFRVGGPYTVVIDSDQYADQVVNDVYLALGETFEFALTLGAVTLEEVVVSATAVSSADVAVGPSSSFDISDLLAAPAINRDIKDLIRIDPRVYIDEGNVDAVECAGSNSRFSSLTVDGVRLNDNFGLNSNGYPTERIPFSYDAIDQVSVELAPFDVQYGGFTACNINAVTKSGTNEFSGSVFYDYTSDSLTGDKLEGDSIDLGSFDEDRYGVTFGGPIIKDKLFFFTAYEKLKGVQTLDRGPAGSGAGREIDGVSQAQADEILRISRDIYGYDPGGFPTSLPVEDEKLLIKFDWNINDQHRASFTYNYNDGFSIGEADSDSNELEFSNHFYERGAEINSYAAQLFSDWNESFSTEVRILYSELDNRQLSLAGTDFGEVQISTSNDADNDGIDSRATVYLGADDSRHANKLKYDSTVYKFAGTYLYEDHVITGGFEREELDVFNLFIQEAEGEYRFSSVADFAAGTPSRITYENAAPSNVKDDAAASFGYEINTLYLQDEFTFPSGNFSIIGGLRYDWYTSGDVPRANANFEARYGFSNQQNFDGLGLLQPRLAFNWDPRDDLNVRGGVGLYSGGNPNVWLSNNYSNDGITQVEVQDRTLDDGNGDTLFTIPFNGAGMPIFDIPQNLFDAVANGTADSGVNALDPKFDIPQEWKYAIGATWDFDMPAGLGSGYTLMADFIYSKSQDSAIIIDGAMEQIGTAPDGRPIYRSIDRSDPDCVNPTSSDCSGRTQDFILTNVKGSESAKRVFSVGLSKSYDFGLDWALGYAYTEASDVNPMTSSVAFSNFSNVAVSDPNNPGRATSNYEIPNRITARVDFERAFFGDNKTKITLFGSANEGRPYSFAFVDGSMFGDSVFFEDRQLLYVPTDTNDPNVVFDADFDTAAFFAFVDDSGLGEYRGRIAPRNAFHSNWWTKFDLKVEQQFRGIRPEHTVAGFFVIENLGNLLNDDWGVFKEASFPRVQGIVDASINDAGQYVFEDYFESEPQSRVTDASLWEMRIGFRYEF